MSDELCHATPKINFCHPGNGDFRVKELNVCWGLTLTFTCIVEGRHDDKIFCVRKSGLFVREIKDFFANLQIELRK